MANEYDDILRDDKQNQLNAAMAVGIKAQPDTEAQLQKLSERTGVPLEAVRIKRQDVEIQDKLANFDYERVTKENPKLSAWLSDPANAAIAHDDWENLSAFEQLVTRAADLPRAMAGGVVGDVAGRTLSGFSELLDVGARAIDRPVRSAFGDEFANQFWYKPESTTVAGVNLDPLASLRATGKALKDAGDWIKPPQDRQNLATDVAGGVGQIGGQIAMFLLTGGAITTATMLAQGADTMADKIENDVADQAMKDSAVVVGGAVTAITEKYGLDKLLNRVPPAIKNRTMRFIADKAAAGGIEAAQEFTEGLLQDIARKVMVNEDAELLEGVGREMTAAGLSAAIVRAALGVRGHRQAQQQEEIIKSLTDQAAASKLRERYPEKFQSYIDQLTKDGPVENIFIPADQFRTYFQSVDMDPAVIASQLGVQNYHEAVTAGTDVVIPTSAFVTQLSGTDHLQGLWDDLRLSQEALTRRELRVQEMNREPLDQELAAAMAGEADTSSEAYQRAYNHFMGELKGRFTDSMAEAYATQSAAAFSTLSNRMGIDVQELLERYDPRVVSAIDNDLRAVLDSVDIDLDPILDRLRAGEVPSEALAFGASLYEFIRDNGGLQAVGEVLDLDQSIERKPGQKKLAQEAGMALDDALQAAIEAGYFPGRDPSELTPTDLLDALGDDVRGSRIYSAHNENDKSAQLLRGLQGVQQWLDEQGIDLANMTNQQVRERLAMAAEAGEVAYDEGYNQAAPLTEDEYIARINPSGKRLEADDRPMIYAGDIEGAMPPDAKPIRGNHKTKDGRAVKLFRDTDTGAVWAQVDGQEAGFMQALSDGEIDLSVAQEYQGQGIGALLSYEYRKADPFAQSGGLTEAGERAARAAFRRMQADGQTLYQMAGEQAATADLPLLAKAQARVAAGEDAELVRQETGWSQGADGKWRFEIDDSQARFRGWDYDTDTQEITTSNPDKWMDWIEESRESERGVPLHQVLHHPALFEAYPSLRYVRVKIDDSLQGNSAQHESGNDVQAAMIRMRDPFDYPAEGEFSALNILMHELQHDIQAIEGFASGGSLGTLKQVQDAVNAQWSLWASAYSYRRAMESKGITAKEAADEEAEFLEESPNLHAIAIAEDAGLTTPELEANLNNLEAQRDMVMKLGPREGYRRLAGEVEARNTQRRLGMTAEQRRATSPQSTEDVERDDQLIAFGSSVSMSAPRQTKRGMIQIGDNRKLRISLFEQADASTFLHEAGHMYLEIMRDLAADPRAPQQIKDDWQLIRDWMGLKDGEEIGVEQHEMFARANEAYLMEGKAPNPELRGVFQRFKAWLVRIYRDVSRLDVKIDNRIRGVFDRIYATDQQIEAAAQELEMSVAWASAAEAGMTEAEYAAYRATVEQAIERSESELRAKAMAEFERERKLWYRIDKRRVRKQVEKEVDAEPVYVAFKALTTGQTEDGIPVKIDRQKMADMYGETFITKLPRSKNRIYAEEGGVDPDVASEVLGFSSGRELINQLANMRKREDVIAARTEVEMRRTYGDMLVDGTIEEQAERAVHNGLREKMLKIELRAIRKKAAEVGRINRAAQAGQAQERAAGEQFVRDALPQTERTRRGADGQTVTYMAFDPEPMKRAAAGLIGQKQVRDLHPHSYLLAERKAAKAFAKAMKDGDYMTAAEQKQRELFNHYLYREAQAKRAQVEKVAKYMRKQGKEPARQRLGKAGADYLEQVDEILERYEFKDVPLNKIAKRESLMAFVNRMEAEGKAVEVPEEVMNEARRVNWQQLTVDELLAAHDAVVNIVHLAGLKNKLRLAGKMRDFDETKNSLLAALAQAGFKGAPILPNERDMNLLQKAGHSWRKFDASLLKIEQLLLWMDGGKPGPWTETIFGLADDAQTAEYDLHRKVTVALANLRKDMPDGWRKSLNDRTGIRLQMPAPSGFVEQDITRYTMLSIALNMGNEQNMQRLRDGNRITDMQMRQIQAAMTDADWKFVQGVWDAIEQLWPDIAALEKRATGLEPAKVEAQSFEVSGKTYRGGYFPIVYDPRRSVQGDKQVDAEQDVKSFFSSGFGRPTTSKGHTKARQESVQAPLLLDLNSVVGGHIAKVVKDISHREAILGMNRLLTDQDIRNAITTQVGPEYYAQMVGWMKTLVADRSDALMGSTGAVKWMMAARTNLSTALMGFRLSTALSQFAGLGASLDLVKPSHLGKAFITFGKNPMKTWAMVAEKSGEMRHRVETLDRDVRDQIRRIAGDETLMADVKRHAFIMVQYADKFVAVPTWLGAYNQALAEGKTEEQAVKAGDSAVRLSQGAGGAKDLSAVQRSNELMKLFTMFYTPFSALYARMRDIGHQTALQGIGYLPTAAARVFPLVIFPAVVGELLAGRGPDDDEDEVWWAVRQMLLYPIAAIPFVRDFTGLAEQQMIAMSGDGSMDFSPSYQLSPVVGSINKAWNQLVRNPLAVATGDKEFDSDMAWKMWEASGIITGLPTAQTSVTGSYLTDLLSGEADPENALELVQDLIYKRKKE